MENDAYILLEAEEENWGLHCCGEWETIKWQIYSNSSYTLTIYYAHSSDDIIKPRIFKGKIDYQRMTELSDLLKGKWIKVCDQNDICDGNVWRIRHFAANGRTIKSTGKKVRYVYGEDAVEKIVSWLYTLIEVDNIYRFENILVQ